MNQLLGLSIIFYDLCRPISVSKNKNKNPQSSNLRIKCFTEPDELVHTVACHCVNDLSVLIFPLLKYYLCIVYKQLSGIYIACKRA